MGNFFNTVFKETYHHFDFCNIVRSFFVSWETFEKIILLQTSRFAWKLVGGENRPRVIKTFTKNMLLTLVPSI